MNWFQWFALIFWLFLINISINNVNRTLEAFMQQEMIKKNYVYNDVTDKWDRMRQPK